MSLAAKLIWEGRGAGNATNGGGFNPSNTNMKTDLAATVATGSAPVVTSASYTFAAGDVGAWLYVKSGSNWLPGWYQIASVAAGAATLTAGLGLAITNTGILSTTVGCATAGSPTSGTWAVDYSQQTSSQLSHATINCSATTSCTDTSGTTWNFGMIGNLIYITGGGATTGWYEITNITAISSSVSFTVDRSPGTVTNGNGTIGGAVTLATAVANWVASNTIYYSGTTTTSSTITLPTGINDLPNIQPNRLIGYTTLRADKGQGTVTTATNSLVLITSDMVNVHIANLILDCASTTTSTGLKTTSGNGDRGWRAINITVKNFTAKGIWLGGSGLAHTLQDCLVMSGTTAASGGFYMDGGAGVLLHCAAVNNSCHGFVTATNNGSFKYTECVSANNNSGGTYHGFFFNGGDSLSNSIFTGCTSYNNSGDGVRITGSYQAVSVLNSALAKNGGYGINFGIDQGNADLCLNYNAFWSNTSGPFTNMSGGPNDVTLTSDPFASPASSVTTIADVWTNFAPNTTANAGGTGGLKANAYPPNRDIGAVQHQDAGGGGGGGNSAGGGVMQTQIIGGFT